ncbi:nucleotidyltransferase family protein [Chryseolinea sp. Jin1]|uniref:Nucleotidyltransferase family protein n=2 Tax=Chryseolinea lacunae TaxID=2801331 RepID=A0ABS1KL42_9BACT|nr:nucleotidyltransferase family protein [Chryseolinea lacunae]
MNKDEILRTLREHLPEIKKKFPVASLALFGSYARGEQTEESDIDVLVEFNGDIGLEVVDLLDDLEKALHHKVDLVSKRALKPHYRPYIEGDAIYV